MNVSTNPCDDFFMFACGNWNKKHMIPEDRASISTFEVLSDQIQLILKGETSKPVLGKVSEIGVKMCFNSGLLEEPVTELDTEATIKAKDFYLSCMNLSKSRTNNFHQVGKVETLFFPLSGVVQYSWLCTGGCSINVHEILVTSRCHSRRGSETYAPVAGRVRRMAGHKRFQLASHSLRGVTNW